MTNQRINELEKEIFDLGAELNALRRTATPQKVPNYCFATMSGEVTLLDLFSGKDRLLAIHNMGQGCRYCTLWADGFNGILGHLESVMSVVLLSPDPPQLQRDFANSRNWRFRLASHKGGPYIREQTVMDGMDNMPGAVSTSARTISASQNSTVFGPGDRFCSLWHLLALAGWKKPAGRRSSATGSLRLRWMMAAITDWSKGTGSTTLASR